MERNWRRRCATVPIRTRTALCRVCVCCGLRRPTAPTPPPALIAQKWCALPPRRAARCEDACFWLEIKAASVQRTRLPLLSLSVIHTQHWRLKKQMESLLAMHTSEDCSPSGRQAHQNNSKNHRTALLQQPKKNLPSAVVYVRQQHRPQKEHAAWPASNLLLATQQGGAVHGRCTGAHVQLTMHTATFGGSQRS